MFGEADIPHDDSYRDSVSTIDKSGKRAWIFPIKPSGKYHDLRSLFTLFYLMVFFLLPHLRVGGEPLFLMNITERKFILFGMIFWPQDFVLLGLAMLTFMVFIVLFTAVFGRLFCGWACPQTVFMEMVFRRIEYWIEGNAAAQKVLAKQPWNAEKTVKKGGKHLVFYLLSFIIANQFLSYIIGMDQLLQIISQPPSQHPAGFSGILLFSFVFFFVFSYMREQVCLVVCPYGRLQGVLLDKNSIVVAYDHVRGEPRHKFRKSMQEGRGDCIDCLQCVKVCPTGIDIRNGTQLECNNCTACIDACNHIMDKVGLPKGLIRYASEAGIAENKPLRFTRRIFAYAAVLILLLGTLSFSLATRSDVEATILRTPGLLFQKQPDGSISNLYSIQLVNKTRRIISCTIRLSNHPGQVKLIGNPTIQISPGDMYKGEMFVMLKPENISNRKLKLQIGVYEGEKQIDKVKTSFMAPASSKKK